MYKSAKNFIEESTSIEFRVCAITQVVSYMPIVRLPATSLPPSLTRYPRSLGMSGSSSTNFSSLRGSRRGPPPPSTAADAACNNTTATATASKQADLLSPIAETPSNVTGSLTAWRKKTKRGSRGLEGKGEVSFLGESSGFAAAAGLTEGPIGTLYCLSPAGSV